MLRAFNGHKWFYYFCPEEEALAGQGAGGRGAAPCWQLESRTASAGCLRVNWSCRGGTLWPAEASGLRKGSRPHRCRFRMLYSSWQMVLKLGRCPGS